MLLCGSTDLIRVVISLETLSVASYLLSGYLKRDPRSSEAALKYLLVGSAAAAVYLYGSSFLYGLSGSTNLETSDFYLQRNSFGHFLGTLLFRLNILLSETYCYK